MPASTGSRILNIITISLASAAVFFLALYKGQPKPFDALFAAVFLLALTRWETWKNISVFWGKIRPYAIYFLLIFIFIIAGVLANFRANTEGGEAAATAMNLARIILNAAVFLFFAFLVASHENSASKESAGGSGKLLRWASIAFFVSFALAIPAYFDFGPEKFISGIRLKAFSMGPLQLGLLSAVGFVLAIGFLLEAKKLWRKYALFALMVGIANVNLWAASRATWAAIAMSMIIFFVFSKRAAPEKWKYFLMLPALAFLLGWLFLPNSPALTVQSFVSARASYSLILPLEDQSQTLAWSLLPRIILENPLGLGFKQPHFANGTFFEVALFGGIGAFIFFIAIVARFLKEGYKAAQILASNFSELKLAWAIAGAAVIITIFFTDAFLWRQTWALLGISLGAMWATKDRNTDRY